MKAYIGLGLVMLADAAIGAVAVKIYVRRGAWRLCRGRHHEVTDPDTFKETTCRCRSRGDGRPRKQHSPVGTPKETGKYRLAPRIQRSVLVSVAESKGDYKVRRLGVVKFQGAWSVVTPLPEVYDLGRLHPC